MNHTLRLEIFVDTEFLVKKKYQRKLKVVKLSSEKVSLVCFATKSRGS